MTPEFWDQVALWGYYAADIGATLFVLLYWSLAPWWRTPFGRHLFVFMLAIALVLNHGLVARVWETYARSQYFNIVRAFLFWSVAAVIIWRVVILVVVQITRRRRGESQAWHE
jgi:hypothetical protein